MSQPSHRAQMIGRRVLILAATAALSFNAFASLASAQDSPGSGKPASEGGDGTDVNAIMEGGREVDRQSEAFKKAKREFRVWRDGDGKPRVHERPLDPRVFESQALVASVLPGADDYPPIVYDASYSLPTTTFAVEIWEPPTSGTDDNGHSYYDGYFANFCSPGAATVLLHEWRKNYTEAFPDDSYIEPASAGHRVTTNWDNDTTGGHRLRSYLVYLAMDVKPTGWETRGMVAFGTSSSNWSATTYVNDLKGAINWEIADHGSWWEDYYYTYDSKSQIGSKSMLMDMAQQRIGFDDVAMIFNVRTTPALGWPSAHNVNHSVAVMGFNTSTDKYYIVDTCGSACSYGYNPNGGGRWVPAADIWSGLIGVVS